MISRKPQLRRQKKIFKQKGKVLRPNQMNINVAAWGRLIKNKNFHHTPEGGVQRRVSEDRHSYSGEDKRPIPLTPLSAQASLTAGQCNSFG